MAKMAAKARIILLTACWQWLFCIALCAQPSNLGEIEGLVKDPTGLALPQFFGDTGTSASIFFINAAKE